MSVHATQKKLVKTSRLALYAERGGTRTGKSAFDKVSSELRKTGGLM